MPVGGEKMEKKFFRSCLWLITYAVALVLLVNKIDLLASGAAVLLRLLKPFFIGFAIAFVLNIPYEAIHRALCKYQSRFLQKFCKSIGNNTDIALIVCSINVFNSFSKPIRI